MARRCASPRSFTERTTDSAELYPDERLLFTALEPLELNTDKSDKVQIAQCAGACMTNRAT